MGNCDDEFKGMPEIRAFCERKAGHRGNHKAAWHQYDVHHKRTATVRVEWAEIPDV